MFWARAVAMVSAACVIAGCAADDGPGPAATSSAAPPKPVSLLDGTYRMDIDRPHEMWNGVLKPGKTDTMYFALRSGCDGDRCVAVGFQVNNEHSSVASTKYPEVFDFVDGAWIKTDSDYFIECGGVIVPGLSTLEFAPRDDGTFSGRRRMACFAPSGSVAREAAITLTRMADVRSAQPMPDPLRRSSLTKSAGAGLNGPYRMTYSQAGGERTSFEANLVTACTRNTERCLTFVRTQGVDGLAPVTAWRSEHGRWLRDWIAEDDCGGGATAQGAYHEEWAMPDNPADPIQRLTGTQRVTHQAPCPSAPTERSVVLERIIA